jgi:hypothetical protein
LLDSMKRGAAGTGRRELNNRPQIAEEKETANTASGKFTRDFLRWTRAEWRRALTSARPWLAMAPALRFLSTVTGAEAAEALEAPEPGAERGGDMEAAAAEAAP